MNNSLQSNKDDKRDEDNEEKNNAKKQKIITKKENKIIEISLDKYDNKQIKSVI